MRRSRLTTLLLLIAAGVLLLAGCGSDDSNGDAAEPTQETETSGAEADSGGGSATPEVQGIVLDEPTQAPDFELTDHEGNPFRLSDHQGRVVSIFFGYTSCPDVCPMTLMHMQEASEQLGEQAEDALFLFVSVDPERDTPEQLAKYVEDVDAEVVGLTGEKEKLEQIWEDYDITVEQVPQEEGDSYLVNHSAQIWVLNKQGEANMILPPSADGEDMANDLGWLLEQTS